MKNEARARKIVEDSIKENVQKHDENLAESQALLKNPSKEDMVTVRIPFNPIDKSSMVVCCINGVRKEFQRGESYEVHKSFMKVLENAGVLDAQDFSMYDPKVRKHRGNQPQEAEIGKSFPEE